MEGTGKKPRGKPRKTRSIELPAQQIKAVPPARPVVEQRVDNPAIKVILPPDKYVVTQPFSTVLNDSYTSFKVGDVIEDYSTIAALKHQGTTSIKKLDGSSAIIKCPHCGNKVVIDAPNPGPKV